MVNCPICGNDFEVYKHELPRKKYCSKACQFESQKRANLLNCSQCGVEFKRKPSLVREGNQYCSRECLFEAMQVRSEKPCAVCGKPVIRPTSLMQAENVVCSTKCCGMLMSRNQRGRNHPNFNSAETTCRECGTVFFEPLSRLAIGKGRFCSKKCKYEYYKKKFAGSGNPFWSGGAPDYRGPNWNQQRMRALMRDDFVCQDCGAVDNLHVHHIQKYSSFENYQDANKLSNLKTLCLSCHLHTEPRIFKKSNGNTVVSK